MYGVRINNDLDLIYLAIADPGCTGPKTCPGHPDDNKPYQFMYVMDGAGVTKGGPGPCKVVQTVTIDPKKCMTPHLMGVNERNHDIYIACVGVRHHPLFSSFAQGDRDLLTPRLERSWAENVRVRVCLQSPTAILRFVQERVVDQIVEYVGFVAVIVVVLAIVIGFIWWCAAPLDLPLA